MKPRSPDNAGAPYARWAWALLLITLVLFGLEAALLEAQVNRLPTGTQRLLGLITLVLPPLAGAALGLRGALGTAHGRLLAMLAAALNLAVALFFAAVLLLAG